MEQLKSCPFCGCKAVYQTFSEEYMFGSKNPEIFCNGCKAIFSIEGTSPFLNVDEDYRWRKKKTVEAWNRRADEELPDNHVGKWVQIKGEIGVEAFGFKEMTVVAFRCSACGKEVDVSEGHFNYCPSCGAKMEFGESEEEKDEHIN